jgi:hypothetical protein
MRRLPVYLMLLGCGGLLLGIQGCSTSTQKLTEGNARSVAVVSKEEKTDAVGAPFQLSADQVGKLLGQVLPPSAHPGRLDNSTPPAPPRLPLPRLMEPDTPLPTVTPELPRLRAGVKRPPVRPELVQSEALEEMFLEPEVPRRPSFVASKRTHVPSQDVALPPALPVLAQRMPDRVSLEDATMEVSTAAALSAALPVRSRPAPHQRMTVPDPYENRLPLTLSVPAEPALPEADVTRPGK